MSHDVVVVGSVNADLVLQLDRLPGPGETLMARGRDRAAGGKGGNQAVAAARSGAGTAFVGAVGTDAEADLLRTTLSDAGVDVSTLRTVEGPSGLAVVSVDRQGQNSIIVAAGANDAVRDLDDASLDVIRDAAVLLCQLEIPIETVTAAAAAAHGTVVLNAAPSQELPDDLWQQLDLLIVNEHEAADLSGESADDPEAAARKLLERAPAVLVTLGGAGSLYVERGADPVRVPAVPVDVVDSTGAGDTFCGVLAGSLAGGTSMPQAVRRASVAAALSVQRAGAVPSIPTADEIDAALSDS